MSVDMWMDDTLLVAVKEELGNAKDLFRTAFTPFFKPSLIEDQKSQMKLALLTRVEVVLEAIEAEIAKRSG